MKILENKKEAYLDDIIKFDITVLCKIFAGKYEKIIYSDTFFLICFNELKEKYYKEISIEKNDFVKKMDKHYGKEALQKLNKIKSELHLYIHRGFYTYYSKITGKDTKLMDSNELEKHEEKCKSIRLAYEELKNNPKYSTDINELKAYCSQDKIRNYLKEYSDDLSLKLFSSIDESKNILDDFVLPLSILDIELDENNSRIIYNLKYNKLAGPINYYLYGVTFYQKFLMKKKELEFPKLNNYKNEIMNLINDDNFLKEFYSILKSTPISYFFLNKRKYDKHRTFEVKFINVNDAESPNDTQCLKEQYEQFMKDIKTSNYQLLKDTIKIKGLSYKIPALTGPSMKIFINPILDFSAHAKKDISQRRDILKSALIILLVHGIAHLLKYYPVKNAYPDTTPFTPKGRENGQCLIYFLFGMEKVTVINSDQSKLINSIETWQKVDNLKEIFQYEEKLTFDSKRGELDLYLSSLEKDDEENQSNNYNEYCFW